MSKSHLVIPDVQAKEGFSFEYLRPIGNFIVEKKPDVLVCLGDFADMPSLSSYDVGKKQFEGRRYKKDVEASQEAMRALLEPIWEYNERQVRSKHKPYRPQMILTLGNHENRINRVIELDPKFDGTISIDDLSYSSFGWSVYPFLEVATIDGIAYSHYFTSGVLGRPVSSARALVQKKHMSCIMGHVQNMEVHTEYRGDGKRITGLFAGTCYEHDEDYLGSQGNNYFRGIHMLYDVVDGEFYCHSIPLEYLNKKYATV
jgi:hypothetical protein